TRTESPDDALSMAAWIVLHGFVVPPHVSESVPVGPTRIVVAGVSVSDAVLDAGPGSVVPSGGVTVAVLTKFPVAENDVLTTSVYVAFPPTGRSTVSLMSPVTGPAVHAAPAV